MKKISLGIIGLLIVGLVYYVFFGASQITQEIKKELNTELTLLQKEGFIIEDREIKDKSEHFVLVFNDPKKIAKFFTQKGIPFSLEDATRLQGLKVGMDVHYLPDASSAVSVDLYPLVPPNALHTLVHNQTDEKSFEQLKTLLKKKTFLLHLSINTLGTKFKGSIKDIDEVLQGKKEMTLHLQGMHFSGALKDHTIHDVKQELKQLRIGLNQDISFALHDATSHYEHTGSTPYDYITKYNIKHLEIKQNQTFNLLANTLLIDSSSHVNNGLSSANITSMIEQIAFENNGKKTLLNTFVLKAKTDNLDVKAFEQLQHTSVEDTQKMNALLQTLISKGVNVELPTLSVDYIEEQGKNIGGFHIDSKIHIDKSLNVTALQNNPMATLSAIDANLNINLSKEIFNLIAQQPKAMLAFMLFTPKDVGDKKVFTIDIKKGKLTVNGMAVN
ncbi:MAG: hypothetical protein DSZ12_03560 [Sulfurovum sp.]|nr:MAG: hypothetical protein DSZ12_03560 [Sulfurovum sp.]